MFQQEIEEVTDQQRLSPRGRQDIKQANTNTSANSSRPNTRSINSQGSLERLQTLKKMHNLSMIAILEPFSDNSHINTCKIQLNMEQAYCNNNGKIWLFWNSDMKCNILEVEDQHITCELNHVECNAKFLVTFIYAKCKEHLRRPLWDKLIHYSNKEEPWCIIGDFNVITSTDEKLGGLPYNMNKIFDFLSMIETCGLIDIGYNGQHFTWCNQRSERARVWKRLDRALVNDK
ncbi:hypothetical protein KY284_010829 [Solanum tuberosum]|nr:hypothetical protein KY284_010829 [Solanum tuberosum]